MKGLLTFFPLVDFILRMNVASSLWEADIIRGLHVVGNYESVRYSLKTDPFILAELEAWARAFDDLEVPLGDIIRIYHESSDSLHQRTGPMGTYTPGDKGFWIQYYRSHYLAQDANARRFEEIYEKTRDKRKGV